MQKFGKFCAIIGTSICSLQLSFATTTDIAKSFSEKPAPLTFSKQNKSAEYVASLEEGALSALKAGMPSLAQAIVEDAVSIENLPSQKERNLMLILADAFIAQGKFESAMKILADADLKDSNNIIRIALVNIGLSNGLDAKKILENVDVKKISSEMLSWYYVAKGYAEYENGDIHNALKYFKEAKSAATTQFALADIMIAENLCKLTEIDSSDTNSLASIENNLRENVKLYFGTPQGFQLAKQHASVLFKLGKRDEALEVLNQQLEIELSSDLDKDEIRIIAAAMTKNSVIQLQMLRDILKSTISNDICAFAMAMLAKNPDISNDERKEFLLELLEKGSEQIRDRILLELAKASIKSYDVTTATKFATRLVEEFPASNYKKDALRILAWTAFASDSNKNPEYRLAASHLSTLADLETDKNKSNELRLIAADCFFLNKDFTIAAKLYESLFATMKNKRGTTLNRAIEANLKRDNYKVVTTLLDSAYPDSNINDDEIWNAEWKLISYLREKNLTDKAKTRIEYSIKNAKRTKSLLIKMQWLAARMSEESGDIEKAIVQCDNILATLKSEGIKDAQTRKLVAANAMLMKARCLESLNKIEGENGAFQLYKRLRQEYPMSDAAKVSYLYQARAESKLGHFAAAQQLCLALFESDTKGTYAYDAVTDAANYTRKLGSETDYKTAIDMLDKLCNTFPNNPRNFYARLSQAEMLRLVNAFADAGKLYEEIINQYNSHPEVHLAWLGLGDCALAQKSKVASASTIFERLYSLPDVQIGVKAEAAYKCAFALERTNRTREANEIRWVTSAQLLSQKLNPVARYWIGRSLFTLATNLENSNSKRDAYAVYEMIVKYKLPSYSTAEAKLKSIKK